MPSKHFITMELEQNENNIISSQLKMEAKEREKCSVRWIFHRMQHFIHNYNEKPTMNLCIESSVDICCICSNAVVLSSRLVKILASDQDCVLFKS